MMRVRWGKCFKSNALLAALKMMFIAAIHWLLPFLIHSKDWPNVRSPAQVNLIQLGMTFWVPMTSKVTNSYQEALFCGPASAASCKDTTNKLKYR